MSNMPVDGQQGSQRSPVAAVTLEVVSPPPDFRLPKRTITLDIQNPTMSLGRSSRVSTKGFEPEPNNGWFDSPVMSRKHATISLDAMRKRVLLTDAGSLHGTNMDHQKLEPNNPKPLSDNDKIRFGVQISRAAETFPPCYIVANIQWTEPRVQPDPQAQPAQSRPGNYRLPDESDNDNSSDSANSECQDDPPKSHDIPVLPTVKTLSTIGKDERASMPKSEPVVHEASRNTTAIDLTDDAEPKQERLPRSQTEISVLEINSPVEDASPCDQHDVVDLTSPGRAPSIDLDESHGDLDESHGDLGESHGDLGESHGDLGESHGDLDESHGDQDESHGDLDESHGDLDDPENEATHIPDSTIDEGNAWGGTKEYSEDSDNMYPSEDGSERLSMMGDEEDMVSSDGEIYDDEEHEPNIPPVEHFIGAQEWDDESTDSESGSEDDSDDSDDITPLSPRLPTDILPPPLFSSDVKTHVPRRLFATPTRRIQDERHPSPSDAVMARPMQNHPPNQHTSQSLGEKSGKMEYFAAREINRGRFSIGEGPSYGGHCMGEINLPSLADLDHNNFFPNSFDAGFPRVSAAPPFSRTASAPRAEVFDTRECTSGTVANRSNCPVLPNIDVIMNPNGEPIPHKRADSTIGLRRTHVGINELVDGFQTLPEYRDAVHVAHKDAPQDMTMLPALDAHTRSFAQLMASRYNEADGGQNFDMTSEAPTTVHPIAQQETPFYKELDSFDPEKGIAYHAVSSPKRGIDQISRESEEDQAWVVQSDTPREPSSPTEVPHMLGKHQLHRALQTPATISLPQATLEPTPPTTPESEEQPAKRRRVAETLGIATIGALSAGIGIFAALVVTAPNLG